MMRALDARDRRMLFWSLGTALALAVALGLLLPGENRDNPLPSTYLAGPHGARAAYETLLNSGYAIERWERPLSELAAQAGPDTVVIFAAPGPGDVEDVRAVRAIVEKGGRVLVTGLRGGFLVPGGQPAVPRSFGFAACQLTPEGLDPLAASGAVWMVPSSGWHQGNPAHRVQYNCAGQPAVVEYDYGRGHVVWWAASTPLENGSLARVANLDLLLNSLGPRAGRRFYWDESLHGENRSTWSDGGVSLNLLRAGLPVLGLLIVFSFSRRSGPVRDLPPVQRAAPIEFLDALGSLYRSAGAASTAVAVALARFRRHSLLLCGLRPGPISAADLAAAVRRRFPQADAALETDLAAAEQAAFDETLPARAALRLVQALCAHREKLDRAAGYAVR